MYQIRGALRCVCADSFVHETLSLMPAGPLSLISAAHASAPARTHGLRYLGPCTSGLRYYSGRALRSEAGRRASSSEPITALVTRDS